MMLFKEKPSERILQALKDLRNFEKRKNTCVDMDYFHDVRDEECFACLGGASAIQRLKPKNLLAITSIGKLAEVTNQSWKKLEQFETSLDCFRVGNVSSAFIQMGLSYEEGVIFDRLMPEYCNGRKAFYKSMRELAYDLAEEGY